MALMRLDRLLSQQGVAARSDLRRMVRDGRVTVNGRPAAAADQKVSPESDTIAVDGKPVAYSRHVYYMLNKPAGVISASRDPRQPTALSLLPAALLRPGMFPAGRLDRDTEGFLLLTDDGPLAHALLSPRRHVDKRYFVRVDAPLDAADAAAFAAGIMLADGTPCRPALLEPDAANPLEAFITLREGKFHQIKRMLAVRGKAVLYLKRTSFAGLELDRRLAPGKARALTETEIQILREKGEILA